MSTMWKYTCAFAIMLFIQGNAKSQCNDIDSSYSALSKYFELHPEQRVEFLDSTLQQGGSPLAVAFCTTDIKSLLGDTCNLSRYFTSSDLGGTTHITNRGQLKKTFKGWRKKFKKKQLNYSKVIFDSVIYRDQMGPFDTVNFFLAAYVKLPILSRIEVLNEKLESLSVTLGILISKDINSITGSTCSPYECINGRMVPSRLEMNICKLKWLKTLKVKS